MIKLFCDACESEISQTANRTSFSKIFNPKGMKDVEVTVNAMVAINGVTNGGEICIDCIKLTVANGTSDSRVTR